MPNGHAQQLRFQSPRQERIHRRLGLVGDGPQAFYRDALRLMDGKVLESTSHVVGHLLREIESAVRDALEPIVHYEARMVKERGNDAHVREVEYILRELGLSEKEGPGLTWVEIARTGFAALAHRRSLERPRPFDEQLRSLWDNAETILDAVLERFEARYLDLHAEADRLLTKDVPSKTDTKYLKDYLPNNLVTRHYFFSHLDKTGWLGPLAEAGMFSDPPAAVRDDTAGTIGFPPWPQGDYLERMAGTSELGDLVLQILLIVPETDNVRVQEAIVAAALRLPEAKAAKLVDRISAWLPAQSLSLIGDKAGSLAARFAEAGLEGEAFILLRRVLDPRSLVGGTAHHSHDEYEFEQVLAKHVPAFVARWPGDTLAMLCDLLQEAIAAQHGDSSTEWDTFLWRKSIASPRPGRRYEVLDLLVNAVRDTAQAIVRDDPAQLSSVIRTLEKRDSPILQRVARYVLAGSGDVDAGFIAERLVKRELFDRFGREPEWLSLLAKDFDRLPQDARDHILRWIDEGPDLRHYDTEGDQVASIKASWGRSRLRPLRGKLPAEWEQRLRNLEAGGAQDVEELEDEAVWVGPTSPRSADELRALSPEDLVGFLKLWKPKTGWRESSPEGLGRTLTALVEENPGPYAENAHRFVGLEPTYVRAILRGLEEATRKDRPFSWARVFDLCEWVVRQSFEDTGRTDWGQDPGWSWSRKAVAALLRAGVDSKSAFIPFEYRHRVWGILEPITWDPDPRPERDATTADSDPYMVTVNSVRGEAVLAEIRYAVWVETHLRKAGAEHGMPGMPEVERNLSEHLDRNREPSTAIRAAFGVTFPVMHWVDPDWVGQNVTRIFPDDESQSALRSAAWSTYLRFDRPYDDVFPILGTLYEKAIAALDPADTSEKTIDAPEHNLGIHLAAYYWRGLAESERLLTRFFEQASPPLRRVTLEAIGRWLSQEAGAVPADVLDRWQTFWSWRLDRARKAADKTELQSFGWWLSSGAIGVDWALQQAILVLREGVFLEPDHLVLRYLASVASARPLGVALVIEGLLDNVRDQWTLYGWRDEARQAIRAVLSSGNDQAAAFARAAVNKLAARGHLEFKDLLEPAGDSGTERAE